MKKCNICKDYKSLDNFHKDMSRKDNLAGKCKECKSIVDKKYAEKNKEKRKRKYGFYNKINKYSGNYNKRRRELHRLDPRIRIRGGARGRALERGIEFDLPSYKDLPKVPKYCPVLGIPLKVGSSKKSNGGGSYNSPSLDRIDNNKGYIKGNIQIISRKANQMKNNGSFKDIKKLYIFMKEQNNSSK